ncbi:hypothetical protein AVEN_90107-1 [Araneus ventricosus]|uniref:Uncharacterized protein n=1 Tax=Araneus ventricosus TaxID=182803 RepID=A0A4Y2PAK2_ARAVE|nr:hypothetical protein AVEN_90107-1 [Araneus ventricosus]
MPRLALFDDFTSERCDSPAHRLSSSHCRRNSKIVPVDQHSTTQCHSVSNSLLTGTADRTPKRDSEDVHTPSRSQSINIHKRSPHIVFPVGGGII